MDLLKIAIFLSHVLIMFEFINCKRPKHKRRKNRGSRYDNRPNIILIMADDLDMVLNSPEVMKKTKRLLREGGTDFKNAFVTSSICCPSRSSILTGKYAHNHNVNSNNANCASQTWRDGPEKQNFGKLLQDAGYRTGYFGKYLNKYYGDYIPPGWDEWNGLIKNSRFYNYSLNQNGRIRSYGKDYKKHYFTNVITDLSLRFFRRSKISDYKKPVMMVISHAAPHGPEDPAPQHRNLLKSIKAPRFPNYNVTSKDKHWIVRTRPHIDKTRGDWIDLLHRRRLLTLLALDDAIARVHQAIRRMRMLRNTYIFFTSDHGYHLGQFGLVKGKSHPYETDIRIPMYVIGPGVPVNKSSDAMALNVDLAPTFLDIAGVPQPSYMDGSSLLSVLSAKKRPKRNYRGTQLTPWRDTFLVERNKSKKDLEEIPNHPHLSTIIRPDPFARLLLRLRIARKLSPRQTSFLCSGPSAPKPPCTPAKKLVCVFINGRYTLQDCHSRKKKTGRGRGKLQGQACVCKPAPKPVPTRSTEDVRLMTSKLDKLASLKKRVNILSGREYYRRLAGQVKLSGDKAIMFAKLLVRIKRKYRKRSLRRLNLDTRVSDIQLKIQEAKKRLEALRHRKRLLKTPNENCRCEPKRNSKGKASKNKGNRKDKKKWKSNIKNLKCFHVSNNVWKTPPRWKGESFTSCINTPNNTYWCLRTINATHNFIYCRFVTNFFEYFDLNKDPFQLENKYTSLSAAVLRDLDRQLAILKTCKGERQCTITASNTPTRIIRPAIRRNFARMSLQRGKYVDWRKYLGYRQ